MFEATARLVVLRFWRKDVQSRKQALMFGAGHGGIEAIILGIIGFISFLQLFFYRQYGPDFLGKVTDSGQIQALQNTLRTYWDYSWYEHSYNFV